MITKEQEYAVGGEMSEEGLDFLLDLIDEYIDLKETVEDDW